MHRIGMETWAGLAMLALSVGVTVPVVLGVSDPGIPRGWWIVIFVVFLAALLAATSGFTRRIVRYGGLAISAISAWTLIVSAQQTGLLLILLVVVAAASVYVAPLWVAGVIVVINTVVILGVTTASAANTPETLILVGFYLLIQVASVLSSATLIREQRMRRELAEANLELRAAGILLSESARTEERLRISRELHDLIGHQLTVLTLQLETARHVEDDEVAIHIDRADAVARDLLRDVRETVGQLRAETPGIERMLAEMAEGIPGLAVTIDVSPGLRISETQTMALIRAAQEIMTNTLRHAEAQELWIGLSQESGVVTLRARDDGRGSATVEFGNGLRGLRERLDALGGELLVDGRGGFEIEARVPAA